MTTLSLIVCSIVEAQPSPSPAGRGVVRKTPPGQQKTSWPEAQEALASAVGRSPSGKEEDPDEPLVRHVTSDCGGRLAIRQAATPGRVPTSRRPRDPRSPRRPHGS